MKLSVVGIGPGGGASMTVQARQVLEDSDVIIGYKVYIALLKEEFAHKDLRPGHMRREEERCRIAVEEALKGKHVAMVCSGDPGIYGMAGLIYEVAQAYDPIEIQIVPGITAACSGAAILGAPLTHDFAVISLSDLLTPWETIEQRLDHAARGDFVLCLYNPASSHRTGHLKKACQVLLRSKAPDTVCGLARNIGRPGESGSLLTLEALSRSEVDMFTTAFIGNCQTMACNGKMVTPRGYGKIPASGEEESST